MEGVHGVFSVQPSSPGGTVTDDEIRFGIAIADLAHAVTGRDLATLFTEAAGRTITYDRFPDEVLAANPFLGKLTDMLDRAQLADEAELLELRRINPEMQSMRTWLAGDGQEAFRAALGASGTWACNQQ